MTTHEAEDLLRQTFAEHEATVTGTPAGLLAGARHAAHRRRRLTVTAAAVGTLAAGGTAVATLPTLTGGGAMPASTATVDGRTLGEPPHDWVWRSSRGMQIAVPGGWVVNDYGCNMTDRPTFVDQPNGDMCLTPEPPTKQVAMITSVAVEPEWSPRSTRDIVLDGVPATRTEGVLTDGRHGGQIVVPSRGLYLTVRTIDPPELTTILDSAHLVDVDHAGCLTDRPAVSSGVVPSDPSGVAVCVYDQDGLLLASGVLDEETTRALVAAIHGAKPGRNPDAAGQCLDMRPGQPDVVLQFRDATDAVSRAWVTFSGCGGRGVDTGSSQVHVDPAMIALFMTALDLEYGFSGDLNR